MWILYASIYAILIGFFTVLRKKATEKSNVLFVLAFSSTIGFLLVIWSAGEAFLLNWQNILSILGKSCVVAMSWIFELLALKNYYISSLQPISAIKIIISFVASLLIFGEPFIWWKLFGVAIIFVSLILLNLYDSRLIKNGHTYIKNFTNIYKILKSSNKYELQSLKGQESIRLSLNMNGVQQNLNKRRIKAIIFFVLACICSETSAILDKLIIDQVSTNQMQFWFMFFVSVIIWVAFFILCLKEKRMLVGKADWKNWAMYVFPVILIVADRFLFTALSQPEVLVSGVAIIKQLSTVVSVIFGGLLYKEPKLQYKLIYLAFILVGIVIVVI